MSVELRNIWFKFPRSENWAVRGIDLTVEKGEFVLIGGPTGSGKTTLSYIIMGIAPSFVKGKLIGEVAINGKHVRSLEDAYEDIGYVFQNFENQLLSLSVEDEIMFSIINNIPENDAEKHFKKTVQILNLDKLLNRYVYDLSYGEMQRVAIASMLAKNPKILVMDEPFAQIDSKNSESLLKALEKINERGITIIVFEHRISKFKKLVDRVVLLNRGAKVFDGSPETAEDMYRKLGLRFREPTVTSYKEPVNNEEEILKLENLWVKRDGVGYVIKNLNFRINKGEKVLIFGENGSGKTTLGLTIVGLLKPDRGEVVVKGDSSMVFQNPDTQLVYDTVYDEIYIPAMNSGMTKENAKRYALSLLERFGLIDYKDEPPLSLSKGQKYRLALASAIATGPDILILDEPTFGQDLTGLNTILDAVFSESLTESAVIINTSDKDFYESFRGKKFVLKDGKLIRDYLR